MDPKKLKEKWRREQVSMKFAETRVEAEREKLLEDLVDISGVSDKVARTLMDQFPNKKSIQESSIEELSDIPGIGNSVARAIKARIG